MEKPENLYKTPYDYIITVVGLAMVLYQREAISIGNARKLAGMSKWEFLEELGRRKIPRHYTEKELGEDLAFAKSSV